MSLVRTRPFISWLVIAIITLGSIRGAIIIYLDYNYKIVYPAVSGLLLMLTFFGVKSSEIFLEISSAVKGA